MRATFAVIVTLTLTMALLFCIAQQSWDNSFHDHYHNAEEEARIARHEKMYRTRAATWPATTTAAD